MFTSTKVGTEPPGFPYKVHESRPTNGSLPRRTYQTSVHLKPVIRDRGREKKEKRKGTLGDKITDNYDSNNI